MYAHLLEPPPKLTEKRPDLPPEVDEVIAKAVAKSKEDRYERPTEFALALKQAVGAGAASGVSAVAAQPGAGGTVLAGASVVGRAQAEKQAEPPAQPPPTESSPAQSPPAESPPAQPAPAGTGSGGGNRRKLLIAGGILAVVLAAVLIPLLAFSGGKSLVGRGDHADHDRRAEWRDDRGRHACDLALRAGTVTGREGVHAAEHPGNGRAGDQSLRVCPDGSNLSTRPVPVLVLSQLSGSAARLRASSQASAWRGTPRSRGAAQPLPANARGSTRPASGAGGSSATRTRRGISSSSGRTRSSAATTTSTCSGRRPSLGGHRRSSAAGGTRSTTPSVSAARRSARSSVSTPSPGSPAARDLPGRRSVSGRAD